MSSEPPQLRQQGGSKPTLHDQHGRRGETSFQRAEQLGRAPSGHQHSAHPREIAGKRLQRGGLLNKHQLFAMKRSLPSTQKHLLGNSRLGEAGISAGIRDRSVWTLTGHGSRHLRLPSLVTPSSSSSPFCNRNKKECEHTGRASPPLSPLVPIKCNGMAPTTHFQTLTAEQIGENRGNGRAPAPGRW